MWDIREKRRNEVGSIFPGMGDCQEIMQLNAIENRAEGTSLQEREEQR